MCMVCARLGNYDFRLEQCILSVKIHPGLDKIYDVCLMECVNGFSRLSLGLVCFSTTAYCCISMHHAVQAYLQHFPSSHTTRVPKNFMKQSGQGRNCKESQQPCTTHLLVATWNEHHRPKTGQYTRLLSRRANTLHKPEILYTTLHRNMSMSPRSQTIPTG